MRNLFHAVAVVFSLIAISAQAKEEKKAAVPRKVSALKGDAKLDAMKVCSIYFHAKLIPISAKVKEPDRELLFIGLDGFQPKGSKWRVSDEEFDCFRNCVYAADEIEPLKKECAILTH